MICLLDGDINIETLNKLVVAYNEAGKTEGFVHIYLNTEGGDIEILEALIDLVNTNKRTTLTAYGKIYSAGFYFFYRAKCERFLLPGTIGMVHYLKAGINVDETKKAYNSEDKAWGSWAKEQNVWTTQLFNTLGFTPAEIAKIKKREEVYFQYSRLLEFMKHG